MSSKPSTIDFTSAVSMGWRDLGKTETKVMLNLATSAGRGDGEIAYHWYPRHGVEFWAESMGMSWANLRQTLSRLARKGLIVRLDKRSAPWNIQGYGVPRTIVDEATSWARTRRQIIREGPEAHVTTCHTPVTPCHTAVTPGHNDNALTRGNADHKGKKREGDIPNGTGAQLRDDHLMRYEDTWGDSPQDDGWDRPSGPAPKKARTVTSQIADRFLAEANRIREEKVSYPMAWSNKAKVMSNIKFLLRNHSRPEVEAMVDGFFVGLRQGGVYQVSRFADLWECFFLNRSQALKTAQARMLKPAAAVDLDEQERRNQEILERARRRKAAKK